MFWAASESAVKQESTAIRQKEFTDTMRFLPRPSKSALLWVSVLLCPLFAGSPSASSGGAEPKAAETQMGPLRLHSSNPRYFADATGRAVYLTGSHVWCNLQDMSAFTGADRSADPPPVFPYEQHLQWMKNANHNFIRLWMWEQAAWIPTIDAKSVIAPLPFARPGPALALDGKPAFDLTAFDPQFFARLKERVRLAQEYGIYVGVMLFQGWSLDTGGKGQPNPWRGHPLNPANNINRIDGAPAGNGEGTQWHSMAMPPEARAVQDAFIRQMVDTLNEFDNVLWEVANESSGSVEWQYHVVNLIRDHQARKPKQHPIGLTAGGNMTNRDLFASRADWISPNHVDNYKFDPPAADGRKVIIIDTDHLWGLGGDFDWVWRSFTRGLNPIYMDPMQFLTKGGALPEPPGTESARKAMGDTLLWSRKTDLAGMTPMGSLSSTNYCLAKPGSEYLIYRPGTEPVVVQLAAGTYTATWFDVRSGSTVVSPDPVEGGGARTLASPIAGPAALHLVSRTGTVNPAPAPQPTPVADWIEGWTDRKSIVIPSAQVTGEHRDFPVLIHLSNDPHLSSLPRADGYDIVFTAGDGRTKLAHSVESFDRASGSLTAWVKVPRLTGSSDTTLYLYLGNPASGYEQKPQDVWTNGYTGVWHLNDSQTGARDETAFQHHATGSGTAIERAGKISGGRRFVRRLSSSVGVPGKDALKKPDITMEAWIHAASIGFEPMDAVSFGDTVTLAVESNGLPSFYVFDGAYRWATANRDIRGAFHHVAGVYDAASQRLTLYVDGEPAGSASASQVRYARDRSLAFGMNAYPNSAYHFDGVIDEARLSSVPRSAAWIKTQYNNQHAPMSFYRVGPVENRRR